MPNKAEENTVADQTFVEPSVVVHSWRDALGYSWQETINLHTESREYLVRDQHGHTGCAAHVSEAFTMLEHEIGMAATIDNDLICDICQRVESIIVTIVSQHDLACEAGKVFKVCPVCLAEAAFPYTVADIDTDGKGTGWLHPVDLDRIRHYVTDPTIMVNRSGPVWCTVCRDSDEPVQATLVVMPAPELRLCIPEDVQVICDGCYAEGPPEIRAGRILARLPVLEGDVPVPPDGCRAYRSDTGEAVAVDSAIVD